MPRGISAEHFGADLIKSVSQMYVGLLQAAAPDMPQPVMDAALMNSSSFGLSPKKLIALTRPHAPYLSERHLRGYGYGLPERH